MAEKYIENVDEDTWRKFAGLCKIENRFVGEKLTEIMKKELISKGIK